MTVRTWIAALAAIAFGSACGPLCGDGPREASCAGLCVDLDSDDANCGACGVACSDGTACSGGTCRTTCTQGITACGADCVDVTASLGNCGSCGHACDKGQACLDGTCHVPCPGAQTFCGGACIDPSSDPAFCGASGSCRASDGTAGRACGSEANCTGGSCHVGCPLSGPCGSGVACAKNSDCAADEVCASQACRRAVAASYTVQLMVQVSPRAPDGSQWDDDGSPPDPTPTLSITTAQTLVGFPNESNTYTGTWTQAGVSLGALDDYTGDGSFALSVVDSDPFGSDAICSLTFSGTVIDLLHQGQLSTASGACSAITLSFQPN